MAKTGKDAIFSFDGNDFVLTEFNVEIVNNAYDNTSNKTAGFKSSAAGPIGSKVTLTAFFEADYPLPALPMRTHKTLVAKEDAAITLYNGPALLTKIGAAVPVSSGVTRTFEFDCVGSFTSNLMNTN
jgi:hypothetical protein